MKNIETNLDIIYEKSKNKIVVNIYSDIKSNENIYRSNISNNKNNNNDTLNFISKVLSFIEFIVDKLYNYLLYYSPSFILKLYRIQYILLISLLLFSFIHCFENNSNISTKLILSAYFPKVKKVIYFNNKELDEFQNTIQEKEKFRKDINDKSAENEIIENEINDSNNDEAINEEIYLFFIIPIKSFTLSIISISFLILLLKLEIFSKLCDLFIFNLICVFLVDNTIKVLYNNKYFFASSLMVVLILYFLKNLIDSIYILLKFNREDFEIFSNNLMAKNKKQFWLKFIILCLLVLSASYFAFIKYDLIINYVIFYLCLLTLISFLCNSIEPTSPPELKPLKNILISSFGLIHLIFFQILKSYYISNSLFYFNSEEEIESLDSDEKNIYLNPFYFISNLFSFYFIDFIRIFIEQYRYNFNFHKKWNKLDYIMILYFLSSIGVCFYSIITIEIDGFIISVYTTKLIMIYFITIFKIKYVRILNNILFIFFIFTYLNFSAKKNIYYRKLYPINKLKSEFFQNLFDFLIILLITYNEFYLWFNLYYSKKNLSNDEIKDLPDDQINKILEYTSNIERQRIKNFKIQIIANNHNEFKLKNAIIIICDIALNNLTITILSFIYQKSEQNIFINILYFSLIVLFLFSKYFIIEDTRNIKEFIYIFFTSFYLSLRLIIIPFSTSKLLYFVFEISIIILMINYSANAHRNKIMDLVIIICLLFNYSKINIFFFSLDIIALIATPRIKNYIDMIIKKYFTKNSKISSYEENEFKYKLSLLLFIFIFLLLIVQIYIFQNIEQFFGLTDSISAKLEFEEEFYDYYKSTINYFIINQINNFFKINLLK